jgi:DNA-binding CsgD family transcriptional regulator
MSSHISKSVEVLVEPLTRREREILALLAQGLSGPEIAKKLTLAVSSVKWHIHQLYGKLGVNSKQRALLRAGELGLLDPAGALPAPKPVSTPKHNLPLQVTRFFGREREIADLFRVT